MEFNSLATDKNWQKYSLEEICLKITSGGTPSRQNPKLYKNGNINWIKTKELNNGYIFESEEKITEEAIKKSSAKLLPVNTILLAMYGATVGELGILGKEMACNQACCALIIDPKKADYRFIFYLLRLYKKEIQSLATGAAQQNLSAKTIKEFSFYIPNLEKQKKIADILSELDKKIDLNTQINQTLEQIAQVLFKSWFVDFDPVRAKAQALSDGLSLEQAELAAMQAISGKTPKELTALSQTQPDRYAELAETAKAFPCEMVEVDGVEVPKGWGKTTLSEICEMQNGYAFKSSEWTDSGIPVIKIGSIQSKILTVEGNGFVSEDNLSLRSNFVLNDGDIVIGLTGAYVGKVGRMPANKRAMLNQRVAKFLAKQINESETFYSFIYMNVIQEEFKNFVDFTAQGSAQPNISTKDILKYPLLLANNDVHLAFEKLLKKILDKSIFNSYQNEILSNSRDLLLPKLLNGEV